MTPVDWANISRAAALIQHTFGTLPPVGSENGGVPSVVSKSSSSKSCTLPSLTSTKHSRLSTPSFSSSDGKGKRPLSFSPMSDHPQARSQLSTTEVHLVPIVQRSPRPSPRMLAPLIERHEIQCQWAGCDLLFSTPTQLTEHIRSVHIDRADSQTWFCRWHPCARSRTPFKSLYSLFLHLRTHTQDRPFQCSHAGCTKTFTRAEYVRLHERSHTGEKPYPCEYADCSKAFSNPSDRTKHIKRTHMSKKEYVCQIQGCGKSYTDPSSLRKHVKHVHGEEAFRQKKHKRTDENNNQGPFDEGDDSMPNAIAPWNVNLPTGLNHPSSVLLETNEIDDDEDVVVDQGAAFNVDILGDNLGELSVGTTAVLPVHRVPNAHALKRIAKKAILPAIHITRACEINEEETHSSDPSKPDQQQQVAFRSTQQHRISAQSGSTAYGSMRSDSMNIDSSLFLPSGHSSMISVAPHPSASPYEYDCIPSENSKHDTRSGNALTIPSFQTSHSPVRRSVLSNELSPSSSFCVSALSGDTQQRPSSNTNPKMAHVFYFLQTLEYNQQADREDTS